jgi:4-cresol dehydrogenase (hydroxylating)
MEVVLADSTLVRTGGGSVDARARHTYKWGTGPYIDGLFSQSNLGIVTSAGISLMVAPQSMSLFGCNIDREEDLPEAVDTLRRLSLKGVIQPNVHVSNSMLVLANLMQYPYDRRGADRKLSESLIAELRREYLVAPWTVVGAIYGDRDRVAHDGAEITRAFARFGRAEVVSDRKLALAKTVLPTWRNAGRGSALDRVLRGVTHSSLARMEALPHLYDTFRGVPSEFVVTFAYFKNRKYASRADRPTVDVDPARDGCGMMWGAFACPITGHDTRDFLATVRPMYERHGFDFSMSMLMINPRTFYALLQFFFDRDDPDECTRMRALYDEVLDAMPRHRFQQMRTSIAGYDRLLEHAPEYAVLAATLKQALDPGNVLAPGRYGVRPTP